MLATFSAYLEARDPEHNHMRAYAVEAGSDLLGAWTVDVRFGRIGARGRLLRYIAENEADARRIAAECLKRRASAPKRIGVPYRVVASSHPEGWG